MHMPHISHSSILREYDIRGIVGETLFAGDAYAIGRAFGVAACESVPQAKICVGQDGRLSSPELVTALCEGLQDAGAEVVRVGIGPTPMLYFATHHLQADGGVMVTGSHNPPSHNGFKFVLGHKPFYGAQITALGQRMQAPAAAQQKGGMSEISVKEAYIETLLAAYDGIKPLRAAWDAGNGAAGEIMQALCERLPGEHIALHAAIDGTFPAHHPDPTVPENLADLIAVVTKEDCALGLAFDGDGDRLGVVDGTGEILWGDQLMALYAEDILAKLPGATVIADVKASRSLFERITALGGNALMWKTGHSHIKAKMAETGAPFAGEMSGHLFFADRYYGYDDGLYAAVRLLGLLSRSDKTLAELREALPKSLSTPELRFPCDDARKFEVIEEVRTRLAIEKAHFSSIDGVRVDTADGWWLLRASNTQAVLVARCEAANDAGLARLKQALGNQLAQSGLSLPENTTGH